MQSVRQCCAVSYRLQILSFEEEPVVQGEAQATGQLQGSLYLQDTDQLLSSTFLTSHVEFCQAISYQ